MRRNLLPLLVASVTPFALLAQDVDVPLRNWTVVPYTRSSAGGGITAMTDVTMPRVFVGIEPCRVADTRGTGGFTAQAGPPALNTGTRNFQFTGSIPGVPLQCGIPAGADAVSVQFTIVSPNSAGNLIAWPPNAPQPTASVLNWDAGITALGNGTIVPLSPTGVMSVRLNAAVGSATAHLVIDVNGYFGETPAAGITYLEISTTSTQQTIRTQNASTTCFGPCGIAALVSGGDAIVGSTTGTFATTGVRGNTSSSSGNAAGVRGTQAGGIGAVIHNPAGVRGEGTTLGVLGISHTEAVTGSLLSGTTELAYGVLGMLSGTDPGCPTSSCTGPWGVFGYPSIGSTGAKHFVEPHPTDASKVIRYTSLEGPEAGTYFRGRGKFERGIARIPVPEDFRMVTDEEGLSVQVTPIGPLATVSVVQFNLNEIVVQSSRNVEFFYTVNGIRRTHKNLASPIVTGSEFMPRAADATIPAYLTEGQKRLLILNGTYREDGAVNPETARRLGWDRIWAERERPGAAPSE
jgi:hypothetical protein